MPYESKPRDSKQHLVCFNSRKGKVFCIISWLMMKSGYTTITLSVEDHRINPAMHQHWRQSRISKFQSLCSAFGGISWVHFIMSYSKWPKSIIRDSYQLQLMCLSQALKKKNGCNTSWDMTKWFCNVIILGHMLQKRMKNYLGKHLNRKSYPDPLYSPDTASSDYHLFRSMAHDPAEHTFILMKMAKNGSTRG